MPKWAHLTSKTNLGVPPHPHGSGANIFVMFFVCIPQDVLNALAVHETSLLDVDLKVCVKGPEETHWLIDASKMSPLRLNQEVPSELLLCVDLASFSRCCLRRDNSTVPFEP